MGDTEIGRLTLIFEGQIKDVVSKIDDLSKNVGDMSKAFEEHTGKASVSWQEMAKGFIAGTFSVEAIKKGFSELKQLAVESIKEYDTEAQTLVRLETALRGDIKGILDFAEARQRTTRISHDDTQAAATNLEIHKLNREEIEKLLPVIQDFAAYKGKSAAETAEAFGRAIQFGTTRGLMPFGIEVDKSGSQLEIFNALLAAGEGNVKGMAEKMGDVGAGQLVILNNNMNSLKETLGEIVTAGLNPFIETINNDLIPALDKWLKKLRDLVNPSDELLAQHAEYMVRDLQRKIDAVNERLEKAKSDTSTGFKKYLKEQFSLTPPITEAGAKALIDGYTKELESWKQTLENLKSKQTPAEKVTSNLSDTPRTEGSGSGQLKGPFIPTLTQLAENQEKWEKIYEELDKKEYEAKVKSLNRQEVTLEQKAENAEKWAKIYKQIDEKQLKEAEKNLQEWKSLAQQFVQMGVEMGEAIADGFKEGTMDLQNIFSQILKMFLSFIEKILIEAILQRTITDFAKAGIAGLAMAAIEAAAVTAVVEILKSQIDTTVKMGSGGSVGGRPHSEGGTFIEAELGEYVERKSAVDYYGVGAMEAINNMQVPREALTGFAGGTTTQVVGRAASGGQVGGAEIHLTNVNFLDPGLMDQYLATVQGQNAVVNIIAQNNRVIKRVLES